MATLKIRSLCATAQYRSSIFDGRTFRGQLYCTAEFLTVYLSLCSGEQCVQHAICTDTQLLYGYGFIDENLYALNVHTVRLIAA